MESVIWPVTHPVAIPGLGEQIGGVGHALHTHSQTNVGLTQRHIITDDLQGPHPGGAVLVYADGVAAGGQPMRILTCRAGREPCMAV